MTGKTVIWLTLQLSNLSTVVSAVNGMPLSICGETVSKSPDFWTILVSVDMNLDSIMTNV